MNTKDFIYDYFVHEWLFSHGNIELEDALSRQITFQRFGGKLLNKVTKYTIKLNNKIVAHAFKKYADGREILPRLEFID